MSGTAGQAAFRKVLVLGLGNPDRADDGVGARVVRQLTGRLPDDVGLRARQSDMLSLIDDWNGFDAVVCVDAAAPMGCPGRIHRFDLAAAALPPEMSLTSGHAFGLVDAVCLARALRRAPQAVIVYAVEGECFDRGAAMTAAVAAAVDEAVDRVIVEVDCLRQNMRARNPGAKRFARLPT